MFFNFEKWSMTWKITIAVLILIRMPALESIQAKTLHIATDAAFWYPFTYIEEDQAKGIHIDVVKRALARLNYAVRFYPRPWKRSLEETKQGEYDAIVSASYKPERADYLIYPEDAAAAGKSAWRITQVEYIVITHAENPYVFEGDLKSLPQPVRALLGYSIVDDLKAGGIHALESPDTFNCIFQLINSQRGSFVTPLENAMDLELKDPFRGKLKIHSKSIASKSYFMVFARKKQKLTTQEITAIWNEIARIRDDKAYVQSLFQQYQGWNRSR